MKGRSFVWRSRCEAPSPQSLRLRHDAVTLGARWRSTHRPAVALRRTQGQILVYPPALPRNEVILLHLDESPLFTLAG